ncbi:MAG: cobalamin B12-binding domain-containing protein [Planctomycetota bacterium]
MLEKAEPRGEETPELANLLEDIRAYRRDELIAALENRGEPGGTADYLDGRIAPLLHAVGRAWAEGTVNVRHEHFVSEVLEDLIRSQRLDVADGDARGTLVLSTLPGELHGLGIQMVSLVSAEQGVPPHILGTSSPLPEIVRAAAETDAIAVGISVSLASGGVETDRQIANLRDHLPREVALVVGGAGARGVRRGPRGVEYFRSLRAFADWASRLQSPRR